jgi:large subunit ribosomal protein L25
MKAIKLIAQLREKSGKKSSHKLRKAGEIPAVLYGHKKDAINLKVSEHEFWHILHNATTEHLILNLDVEGLDMEEHLTLVRDVQHDPVTGEIVHVDFQRISPHEKIKVGVPVLLKGIPLGVKEFGGILDHGIREVRVHTTPVEIPEALEIDVTPLEIGDTVHISDLFGLYPSLEFIDDEHLALAHVSPPKKLEVLVEEAEGEEEVEGAEAAEEGEGAGEAAGEEGGEGT